MGALDVAPWVVAFLLAFVLPLTVREPVGPVRRPGEVSLSRWALLELGAALVRGVSYASLCVLSDTSQPWWP